MINIKDQKTLENYYKRQIEAGEQIRIKSAIYLLDEPYACFEILEHVNSLGIDKKHIWRGETIKYESTMPSGHIILSNDLLYDYVYKHRYVVAKGLNIEIEQIEKYLIHHKNGLKGDNDIMNLFICYDVASHVAYHQAIKHNSNIDIKEFTLEYIEKITTKDNVDDMKDYLKILDKLEKVQNDKKNMFI